mgnify:CR=1 FL=1
MAEALDVADPAEKGFNIEQRRLLGEGRAGLMGGILQHDAEVFMRKLAKEEGVFAGVSSGGAAWAAYQIAKDHPDAVIAFIVCDRGDRYLSTGLYGVKDDASIG